MFLSRRGETGAVQRCQGFYGLIASGWSIEDSNGKGVPGALPPEAGEVEVLVGLFDTERASATLWTADEFNEAMAIKTGGKASRSAPPQFSYCRLGIE